MKLNPVSWFRGSRAVYQNPSESLGIAVKAVSPSWFRWRNRLFGGWPLGGWRFRTVSGGGWSSGPSVLGTPTRGLLDRLAGTRLWSALLVASVVKLGKLMSDPDADRGVGAGQGVRGGICCWPWAKNVLRVD